MIDLHTWNTPNGKKISIALEEMGLAYKVRPVNIGKDATIGAGSVITKNAPADQLTVSRARQVTISEWHRPRKK